MENILAGIVIGTIILFWMAAFCKKPRKIKVPYTENDLKEALKDSDDYLLWGSVFIKASESLIKKGIFTLEDFQWSRGWTRSTNKLLDYPYFVVPKKDCKIKNRVYLDVLTGVLYYSYNGKTKYIRFKEV